jgi:hypothetical protein
VKRGAFVTGREAHLENCIALRPRYSEVAPVPRTAPTSQTSVNYLSSRTREAHLEHDAPTVQDSILRISSLQKLISHLISDDAMVQAMKTAPIRAIQRLQYLTPADKNVLRKADPALLRTLAVAASNYKQAAQGTMGRPPGWPSGGDLGGFGGPGGFGGLGGVGGPGGGDLGGFGGDEPQGDLGSGARFPTSVRDRLHPGATVMDAPDDQSQTGSQEASENTSPEKDTSKEEAVSKEDYVKEGQEWGTKVGFVGGAVLGSGGGPIGAGIGAVAGALVGYFAGGAYGAWKSKHLPPDIYMPNPEEAGGGIPHSRALSAANSMSNAVAKIYVSTGARISH